MQPATDMAVLLRLLRGQPSGPDHKARLEAFYAPQATRYDAFRERLLHGRAEMLKRLDIGPGQSVVELGAGTGRNVEFYRHQLDRLAGVELVDLCGPLLEQARQRLTGQANVRFIETDATTYVPDQPVDRVYFSYSLTMIPDWRSALQAARNMLKPDGRIGVVDFFIDPVRHAALSRGFWQRWFGHEGVRLSAEHLPALERSFATASLERRSGGVPYIPLLRAPYYIYTGTRR
ncbi:MAG: methyltransferase domain-containing protein [Gammaproteobacteria bacterium]|nr:methyltransferase domain-containing protein [Gammaproteobacteria bacterium]